MSTQRATLRELLARNLKERRRVLGLSQEALAQRADTSTHHVAMIELMRNFPSPEMLERLAEALELEPQELFSLPPSPAAALKRACLGLLPDLTRAAAASVEATVRQVVTNYAEALEEAAAAPAITAPGQSQVERPRSL